MKLELVEPGGTNASDLQRNLIAAADALDTNRPQPIDAPDADRSKPIGQAALVRELERLIREYRIREPLCDVTQNAIVPISLLRDVVAALGASPSPVPTRWQPIETAPKDGTYVVGALIDRGTIWRVHEMAFNGLAFYTHAGGSVPRMTHWMPLPAPPAGRTEDGR